MTAIATPHAKPGRKRRAGEQPIWRKEIKLGESELAEIDAARGDTDRTNYIRDAALAAARGATPGPDALNRAAERLVFALHIYRGYKVDSRGPAGCIMEALDQIAPDVAAAIRDSGEDDTYAARWNDNGAPR